ncbi:Proteasome subunit beta type-1 [Smittium culicis]|uniref:Proteasome subunit beta n=1 Tax=Smittium culicis TaxID=133412 RepID=A0A1R1YED8_9FUNG|nr:Proteasome subunit beta type-1 [Smittium culicis]OMJ25249.1 Proteasome subunit beta type-1 [Smittium culicis]
MDTQIHNAAKSHARWEPYVDNGGTSLAIAGPDFCIIASDTRQSEGYSINTRYDSKIHKITDKVLFATSGYSADGKKLAEVIKTESERYFDKNDKVIGASSIAQMISIIMYQKRFFPYYVFPILAGLDSEGKGCVFSYDPVGNMERVGFQVYGSASALIQPFLDNQVGLKHQQNVDKSRIMTKQEAFDLAIDSFTSATERDIYTGDYLEIYTVDSSGIHKEVRNLKFD